MKQLRSVFKNMPDYVFNDTIKKNWSLSGAGWVDNFIKNWEESGLTLEGYAHHEADKYPMPENFFGLLNYKWTKQIIKVNLFDFDRSTQEHIMEREFGEKNPNNVPYDKERTELQRQKAVGDGKNEPITVFKNDKKYGLLEGWHRTMGLLKLGDNGNKDPRKWKRVTINAWVGEI